MSFCRTSAFCALLCALGLSSCTSSDVEPQRQAIVLQKDEPSQVGKDTRVTFSSEGIVRAVLNAKGVRMFDQKHFTLLDSAVRVDFFNDLNQHSSVLTSRRAFINDATNNMTAYDSVHIVSDSGTVVDTDSLFWDNKAKEIRSDAYVRIAERNGRITKGHGFVSDQDLENYHIMHPIIDAPANSYQDPRSQTPLSTPFKTGMGRQ